MSSKYLLNSLGKRGFTLIELLVVMAIGSVFFGILTINLFRVHSDVSQDAFADSLVADLKLQQSKAMNGSTEGRTTGDSYGVHFLADQYILFHGTSYSPSQSSNFSVELPENVSITGTQFPNNTIVFTKVSGEIADFTDGNNTITITENNSGVDKVITLNRYGVIVSVE